MFKYIVFKFIYCTGILINLSARHNLFKYSQSKVYRQIFMGIDIVKI